MSAPTLRTRSVASVSLLALIGSLAILPGAVFAPASAADVVGTPKNTWAAVTAPYNGTAANQMPVSTTSSSAVPPTYTSSSVTLPFTAPTTYNGSTATTTATVARSFTFDSPNDNCVLNYSVTGTPSAGGWTVVAYNSRTNAAIALKDYPTWGASYSRWSTNAGFGAGLKLSDITSGFTASNGGTLLWGYTNTTAGSGDVTASAALAASDAAGNPILKSDLTDGNIVLALYYVSVNATGTAQDVVKTIDMSCTGGTTPASYTVTAQAGTGGTATATDNGDGTWSLVATADEGFTFAGWSCDASQAPADASSASTSVTPAADTTCTATFTADPAPTYTVTAQAGTGGSASATDSDGDGTWDLVATADAGFTFAGWSCDAGQSPSGSTASTTVTPTADTTCTATFTADPAPTYTVTAQAGTGGTATATDNGDGTWSLAATPAEGFTFAGWSCDSGQSPSGSTATTTVTPTADTTCTATFTAIPAGIITHTTETVKSVFIDNTASPLTDSWYSVQTSKGRTRINGVNPGVLFYWAKFTSTGTGPQTLVTETSSASSAYFLQFVSAGSNIYKAGQTTVAKGYRMSWNSTTGTLTVSGLAAGDYWIGIKFSASAVSGLAAPSPSSVTYGFTAGSNAESSQSLTLSKKS